MNKKNIFRKSTEKGKTILIPRKKIPPLNLLQKSKNSNGLKKNLLGIKNMISIIEEPCLEELDNFIDEN